MNREHMRNVVCWDLDSTLADTVHRQHMVDAVRAGGEGAPTWDDYSLQCMNDDPIDGSVALLRLLYPYYLQHIVSGRGEIAHDLTQVWLGRHSIPVDHVELRKGDTDNALFKIRYIRHLQATGYRVALFCEDHGPAGEEIEEATGVPVLGVNPFYPLETQLATLHRMMDGGSKAKGA
jgi:hypothetical protein